MPYRPGKRSAGFNKGKLLATLGLCLAVLCMTVFATHQIYTRFVTPASAEGNAPGLQMQGGNGEDFTSAPSSLEASRPETTARPTIPVNSQPEDLPGVVESDMPEQGPVDPTGADEPMTEPETTEPEVTEAEVTVPEPETTEPEVTEPEVTEPEATEPESTTPEVTIPLPSETTTTVPSTVPPTTTPPTTVPPTTVPATTAPATTVPPTTDSGEPQPGTNGLYSKGALLQRLDGSGGDLFALEADTRVYPASLAKMMTCIVTLENNDSLDTMVTITSAMLKGLAEAGASRAGFKEGETVQLRDLMYGMMLPSGADATNAAAVFTAGSVDAFVGMMNDKAAALGMSGTNFTNTHGLHDSKQYSTCRDLMTLLRYCLDNGHFRVLFTTGSYTTTKTQEHPNGITLRNNMSAALAQNPRTGVNVKGNKTGFTTPAGQCLASLAVVDGQEYILITVGAGKSGQNKQRYNMLDALELYGRLVP